jgi:uncharacterized membrane protein YcaP (DUF421 family)
MSMELYIHITIKLIIGFGMLFLVTKKIGGREITNLNAFDFISAIVLSELVGNALYAEELHIGHMIFTIVIWASLIIAIDKLTMKSQKVRHILDGKPTFLIKNGSINKTQLQKTNMDLNELLSLLREKEVFAVREVDFAFLEPNGTISLLKRKPKSQGADDKGMSQGKNIPPLPVIMDGVIQKHLLSEFGLEEKWLERELEIAGYADRERIFYAEWSEDEGLYVQFH